MHLPVFQDTTVSFLPVVVVETLTSMWRHFCISLQPLFSCHNSSGIGFAYLAFLPIYSLCSGVKWKTWPLFCGIIFFFWSCVSWPVMIWEVFLSSSDHCGTDLCFLLFISWSCQYNSTVLCWVIWLSMGLFPWTGDWAYSLRLKERCSCLFFKEKNPCSSFLSSFIDSWA